jgi:hypothetical protein
MRGGWAYATAGLTTVIHPTLAMAAPTAATCLILADMIIPVRLVADGRINIPCRGIFWTRVFWPHVIAERHQNGKPEGRHEVSLEDKVAEAFEKASTSMDPLDWRVFHALQGALLAERAPQHEAADLTGIPSAAEAGYPACLHIPRPQAHD